MASTYNIRLWSLFTLLFVLTTPLQACKNKAQVSPVSQQQGKEARAKDRAPSKVIAKTTILFLGDSLTAGYGLAKKEAYPSLVQDVWTKKGLPYQSKNAGVSGDTTAGILRRLDWVLTKDIHTAFLCIGANDGMRGLSLSEMKTNITNIIKGIQAKGIAVVLAGMKLPPNYGKQYTLEFEKIYEEVAREQHIKRMPFLLQDVAGKKDLNQKDGIHPNAEGHKIVATNVLMFFKHNHLFQKASANAQPKMAKAAIPPKTKKTNVEKQPHPASQPHPSTRRP